MTALSDRFLRANLLKIAQLKHRMWFLINLNRDFLLLMPGSLTITKSVVRIRRREVSTESNAWEGNKSWNLFNSSQMASVMDQRCSNAEFKFTFLISLWNSPNECLRASSKKVLSQPLIDSKHPIEIKAPVESTHKLHHKKDKILSEDC